MVRKIWLLLLVGLCTACNWFGGNNTLKITNRNFGEEIETHQNLIFEFNHPLAAQGMVGEWHDKAYFKLSPQVAGKFRWETSSRLVFSPLQGFAPDTDYELTFQPELTQSSPVKGLRLDKTTLKFHTPYLDLAAAELFWSADEANQPQLLLSLGFSYPIEPTQLQSLLALAVAGKSYGFKMLSASASSVVQLAVLGAATEAIDNQNLEISIRSGLQIPGGNRKAPEITWKSIIPEKDKFKILSIEAENADGQKQIRVIANQAVGTSAIEKEISLGGTEFSIERTENGFLIKGNFGQTATVTIKKSLKGVFGGSLEADISQVVVFGEARPSIAFAEKGNYLSTAGFKNIALKITGIEKIRVEIYKVYANNVLHYLRASGQISRYYGYDESEEQYFDNYYGYVNYDEYGDKVYDVVIPVKNLKRSGGYYLAHLDFEHNRDYKGIYAIKVSNDAEQYVNDSRMVSFSDIGLLAKQSNDEITVFAHSIHSAEPMPGVEITLISSNNQEVYTLKTEPDGIARFKDLAAKTFGFTIKMIAARQGDEFTFMHFGQAKVSTEDFGLGGLVSNSARLLAFLYAERELYRPGETINLRTIVRNDRWQPVGEIPIKIRFISPEGKEIALKKGILTKEGSFTTAIAMPAAAITGLYTAEVLTANHVVLGSKGVFVEEFMPDRLKINGKADKTIVKTGETVRFDIEVFNLFGPPAVGRKVEISYGIKSKPFSPKGYSDYNFNFSGYGSGTASDIDLQTAQTDDKGYVSGSFTFAEKNTGLYDGAAYIVAFDETGRAVRRKISFLGVSQDVFLGMKYRPRYIQTRAPYPVPVIALDAEGKVLNNVEIEYKIVRYRWTSVLEQDSYGRYRYVSQSRPEVLKTQRLTVGGTASTLPFLPEATGEYELRIARVGDESHYVSQFFYAYEWGTPAESASYQISKEGRVLIETDKPAYNVGEEALLRFKVPFDGRLIVTVEREKLQKHFVIQTKEADAIQKLKIDPDMLPNVYITATLIRPIQDNSLPITVAHGFVNITVNEPSRIIQPKIIAADNSRSGVEQEITVQTGIAGAEVSVAVVDEGILQIKNTKTPDPYGYFYQTRALEVETYSLYSRILSEYKPMASAFGSDFAELGKRLNPFQSRRVKPVSFWSGTLTANSSGKVSFKVMLPEGFSGQCRIMAVVSKGHSFGSAEKTIVVADPVVLSCGLPRFLAPGDEAEIPTTLTNTTKSPLSGKAIISVSGPLEIIGEAAASLSLAANAENRTFFRIKAKNSLGNAKVIVSFDAGKEKYHQEIELAVRPATTLTKYSGSGEVTSSVSLDMTQGLLPGTISAKLVITQLPIAGLAPLLVSLVGYPYGCLEQTTSKAFPQLYVKALYEAIYPGSDKLAQADYFVQEAIRKIMTMQRYDGSLSFWPEGDYYHAWSTVYATHFLVEARKAGFEVEEEFLSRCLKYIAQSARTRNLEDYIYLDNAGKYLTYRYVPRSAIYALYVLAAAGKPERSAMNYFASHKETISPDALYLLAGAFRLIGDQATARRLQPAGFPATLKAENQTGGDFASALRDRAIALNALIETDPQSSQIPALTKAIAEDLARKQPYYFSTQEQAYCLLALGKLAAQRAKSAGKAIISDESGKKIGEYSTGSLVLTKEVAAKNIKITAQGGSVFYYWEVEGLPAGEIPTTDNNLTVRRQYYTRTGQEITNLTFKQNDLIVVKITLATKGRQVDNVVITDILPAGLEVENPRISQLPELDWIINPAFPQSLDIRDDRVNLFTHATALTKSFYYTARATSKGTFRLGPIAADAMYNADFRSYNGGGTITIE